MKKIIKENIQITEAGSLGILALGAKGVKAWRKVRDAKKLTDKKLKK